MKKITLLAFACAMFMAPAVVNAQEVTYVEDPAQGYIFNRMQDNWFIEAEGGAGVMMSKYDKHADFGDRIGWKANLNIGKWFSPLLGVRIGGEFNQMKGATMSTLPSLGMRYKKLNDGFNQQQFNNVGVIGDVMFNLTNWLCGYKPARVYNGILYGGLGTHWVISREIQNDDKGDWKYAANEGGDHSRNFSARVGLLNTFRLSNRVNLLLDLRFEEIQEHIDGYDKTWTEYPSALLGLSFKLGKTEWNAPIVPVCPEIKYTDAYVDDLRSKLEAANQNIASLKQQLDECRNKKPEVKEQAEAPLATIYFPIDRYDILGVQKKIVNAVAEVMKNENNNYILTGWADNYTGNDKINTRLRKNRVATVKKALVSKGIEAGRLDAQINDGNLTNYGAKCASLDRAVTINRAK